MQRSLAKQQDPSPDLLYSTPGTYQAPLAYLYEFYLSGEIGDPKDYTDWFHIIRNATERDQVVIHINSPGGSLTTSLQFMSAMKDSDATIVCSVEGECASGATLVFLAGDVFVSSPHSLFMFHNYSGGSFGKGNEMHAQIIAEKSWASKIFRDSYEGVLTEDEIEQMLEGKDFWLPAEEVIERLQKKIEELQQDNMEPVDNPTPRRVRKNATKKPAPKKPRRKTDEQ